MLGDVHNLTSPNQSLVMQPAGLTNLANDVITEDCHFRTAHVQLTFKLAQNMAQVAFSNARQQGVNSEYGFRAMFKAKEALSTVTAVLDHIYKYKGKPYLKPHPNTPLPPRLSCATEDSAKLYDHLKLDYDPWHRCQMGGHQSHPMKAFYAEYVMYLCQNFPLLI